jgi:hypothetical protein
MVTYKVSFPDFHGRRFERLMRCSWVDVYRRGGRASQMEWSELTALPRNVVLDGLSAAVVSCI